MAASLMAAVAGFYLLSYPLRRPKQPEGLWIAAIGLCYAVFVATKTAFAITSLGVVDAHRLSVACLLLSVIPLYCLICFLLYNRLDWHGTLIVGLAFVLSMLTIFGSPLVSDHALRVFQLGAFYTTAYCTYLFYAEYKQRSWFKLGLAGGILLLCAGGILDILTIHAVVELPRVIDLSMLAFVGVAMATVEVKRRVQLRHGSAGDVGAQVLATLRLHVAVVDDNRAQLRLMEALFREAEIRFSGFGSAEEALIHLEHGVDLLVTDYHMPGMNGAALVEVLLKKSPDLKAIVLTGDPTAGVYERCLTAGARRVLIKPLRRDELFGEIYRAVRD